MSETTTLLSANRIKAPMRVRTLAVSGRPVRTSTHKEWSMPLAGFTVFTPDVRSQVSGQAGRPSAAPAPAKPAAVRP